MPEESKRKKNPYSKDLFEDGRISMQSAFYTEPTVRSKMFDDVLLCGDGKNLPQGNFVHNGVNRVQKKGNTGKGCGKKSVKKDVVDLRTLLTTCAQAYFAAGLEARMVGSGTKLYNTLLSRPTSSVDVVLKKRIYTQKYLKGHFLMDNSSGVDLRNVKSQTLMNGNTNRQPSRKQFLDSSSLSDFKSTEPSTSLSMDDVGVVESAGMPSTSRPAEVIDYPSSTLVELTTRFDYFKERHSQLMEQLHNLDLNYGTSSQSPGSGWNIFKRTISFHLYVYPAFHLFSGLLVSKRQKTHIFLSF